MISVYLLLDSIAEALKEVIQANSSKISSNSYKRKMLNSL